MSDWEAHLRAEGLKERSIESIGIRVRGLLGDALTNPLDAVTPKRAARLYQEYAATRKTDTHKNALADTKRFFRWALKDRRVGSDPFAAVEGTGRRSRGKPQLGVDEARELTRLALRRAGRGDRASLATLLALYLGMRASEIVGLTVRDVDDNGRLLVIGRSKTAAGVRRLEVPEVVRAALLQACAGKGPQDRILPYRRQWVRASVHRLCSLAGVSEVCAHGLRGTHVTLATEVGMSGRAVAAAVGHARVSVTERHYMAPGVSDRAQARLVGSVLGNELDGTVSPAGSGVDI